MKIKYKNMFLYIATISILLYSNCTKDPPPPVSQTQDANSMRIRFENKVGNTDLNLDLQNDTLAPDTKFMYSSVKNKFTISTLRYIVSNIILYNSDGTSWKETDSYHLIEVTNGVIKDEFRIASVPGGKYKKISFTLGVDSLTNHDLSLAKGDLVNISGMSWTWATGYIFYKLEGRFEKPNSFYKLFKIHNGVDRNRKTITLNLPNDATVDKNTAPSVHIISNILSTFGTTAVGSTIIDLNEKPIIMVDAIKDVQIANNNAAALFYVDHVHNDISN